jgi:hypothetical protein
MPLLLPFLLALFRGPEILEAYSGGLAWVSLGKFNIATA